jgi:hypothetical protein
MRNFGKGVSFIKMIQSLSLNYFPFSFLEKLNQNISLDKKQLGMLIVSSEVVEFGEQDFFFHSIFLSITCRFCDLLQVAYLSMSVSLPMNWEC